MVGEIIAVLKALVTKVPWYKVPEFLGWVAEFAVTLAKYVDKYGGLILSFIKANPFKVLNWFFNGYSAFDVIKQILKSFGINI